MNGQTTIARGVRAEEPLSLRKPSRLELPRYKAALQAGWSPDNVRGRAASEEQLQEIAADPDAFLASLDDPQARGGPIKMPDGSTIARLPGYQRWLWDGDFCGSIGFRWQAGSSELPEHVLGHIGYAVTPWKQRRGYATRALALLLPECRSQGLSHVYLTTTPDNPASQRVILANGGRLLRSFDKAPAYGGGEALLFRIDL